MSAALVLTVFALGVALSAAPGALNIETLRRGLHHGFWPAFQVQLGALAGDAVWVTTACLGALLGLQTSHATTACLLGGGGSLLWIAGRIAWRSGRLDRDRSPGWHRNGFVVGGLLALASPLTFAFWVAANSLMHDELGRAPNPAELVLVGTAYVTSVVGWGLVASVVAVWGRRWIAPASLRVINLVCAALLCGCGVQMLGHATSRLAT